MTQFFRNRTFDSVFDRDSAAVFGDMEFDRCCFKNCSISITFDPKLRSTVRNVRLADCKLHACSLSSAVIQDVTVDGLKTNGLFQAWSPVFRHVTFKGYIEDVMISHMVAPGIATAEQQRAFDEANEAFYADVDWALDIKEAEFGDLDLRGVPAKLIKRDPETQVIVTRAKAMKGDWRNLDLTGTHWRVSLEGLLKDGHMDTVLIAPKRHKKFKALLRGLQLLREAGVAEPY